ncbi:MAG: Gfo/Idh/MocA family oxidoreductase [Rhodobacteraceae bacterium]|nr:Gfo/Idh/MocA family oxidoreductase [Paracoccaceae bacterium]
MNNPIRWGVIGAAGIAHKMFLPAAAAASNASVRALASRSMGKAQEMADKFDIPKVYEGYDALLADPDIDAVYIPLPNKLHVEATLSALAARKHVLCEKPISMKAEEVAKIADAATEAQCHAMEGFMVAYHPQWEHVRSWIASGAIGDIKHIEGCFTYFLDDAENIRNHADGGALRDVGVYPIFATRLITGKEPKRVLGRMVFDDTAAADVNTSAWMEFDGFDANFHVNTRADKSHSIIVYGTHGRIEMPTCFNPADVGAQSVYLFKGDQISETKTFTDVFQFALQVENVSDVFAGNATAVVSLENSAANQRVVDAIIRSAETNGWVDV